MSKKMLQRGDVLDWTNGTGGAKTSGTVVEMKHILGVLITDVANTKVGAAHVEGVHQVPKVSSATWVQGEKLVWKTGTQNFAGSGASVVTGDITGAAIAIAAGANGETTAYVKLTPGNATLT